MLAVAWASPLYLWLHGHLSRLLHRRCATPRFNVVSIATTTGYASTDLQPVADLRAAVDAVPVQLRHLLGLDRRRHQDDPRAAALQAGLPRVRQTAAPECRRCPLKLGGQVIENKIIFSVLAFLFIYIVSIVTMTLLMMASGLDELTSSQRRRRQHQQYRSRAAQGRPGDHLCGADRFPDLGLHVCNAARAPGTVHRADRVHAGVLAQVSPYAFTALNSSSARARAAA